MIKEQTQPSATLPLTALLPGEAAPDFTLNSGDGLPVTLSELRGRPVILAFYPGDWSPACGEQMSLYNEVLPEFERFGAQLLGISVDSVWSHAAFAASRNIRFPLLSDFEPKGAVAQMFGAYRRDDGFNDRALFVLDQAGKVVWSHVSSLDVNPGADGILSALDSIPVMEVSR